MMRINKLAAAVLLGVSALGLSACATGLRTKVSRYQAMPAPQGQSFVVVPMNPTDMGGLEFSRYAELVAQRMQAQGYARAPSSTRRRWSSSFGYGVDDGHTEIVSDPFYGGYGYGYGGWGYPVLLRAPRLLLGLERSLLVCAGGYGGGYIRSYTYYVSELDLDIRRKVDNASLFEGKAKARSRTDDLAKLVPSLVEAMFTGFPGTFGRDGQDHHPVRPAAGQGRLLLSAAQKQKARLASAGRAFLVVPMKRARQDCSGGPPTSWGLDLFPGHPSKPALTGALTPRISPPAGASAGGCRHRAPNPRRAAARSA